MQALLTEALRAAIKGVIRITATRTHAAALQRVLCDRPRRRRRRTLDDLPNFSSRQHQQS